MAEPTPPNTPLGPGPNAPDLAEAIRQITRLNDLLAGGAALPAAGAAAGSAVAPAGRAGTTDYTFRAPAAVGSRVTVRPVPDPGGGEQLRAAAQAYAHGAGDLLGAEGVTVSPTDTLPSGGEYVVVLGRLPGQPGGADGGATLRSAFVRFGREVVNVEFVARANDPQAEGHFDHILRTIRPTPAVSPVTAAIASLSGPVRSLGGVAFDLPPEFGAAGSARFTGPGGSVRVETALSGAAAPGPQPVAPSVFHELAAATRDDGRPVQYEVAPAAPEDPLVASGAAPRAPGPGAGPVEAKRVIDLNGRRIVVTATAGDSAAAEELVRTAVDRVQPPPK